MFCFVFLKFSGSFVNYRKLCLLQNFSKHLLLRRKDDLYQEHHYGLQYVWVIIKEQNKIYFSFKLRDFSSEVSMLHYTMELTIILVFVAYDSYLRKIESKNSQSLLVGLVSCRSTNPGVQGGNQRNILLEDWPSN